MAKLGFDKLELKDNVSETATLMTDRGHLDPNPIPKKQCHEISIIY